MKKLSFIFVLITLTSLTQASDLGKLIEDKSLFEMSQTDFEKKYMRGYGFRWNDSAKTSARAFNKLLFLYESKAIESIVTFKEDKVVDLSISVYNRGDQAEWTKQVFVKELTKLRDQMGKSLNAKWKIKRDSKTRKNTLYYFNAPILYRIDYVGSEFGVGKNKRWRSEYIRVQVSNKGKQFNAQGIDKAATVTNMSALRSKLVKDKDGNVYINSIPMIDQGPKGYCACAASARILQYYGRNFDQHQVAQLAETSALGTDSESLLKALEVIAKKTRLKRRVIDKMSEQKLKSIIRYYNLKAKRNGKAQIDMNRFRAITQIYAAFDKDTLIESLSKQGIQKFEQNIISNINKAIPLLWNVILGVVPEGKMLPQSTGGHMRLIIGYNKKEKTIYFSDTWGRGHELKKMKLEEAYAINFGLTILTPY